MTDVPQQPWRRCRFCKEGRIALLISFVPCEDCGGTGINLSDDRLKASLFSMGIMVRTAKLLRCHGVENLGQLLRFVHQGKLSEITDGHVRIIAEALLCLENAGLPLGPNPSSY